MRLIAAVFSLCLAFTPVAAHELGLAGLLSKSNTEDLDPLTLASGQPLGAAPLQLKSGTYYEIEIEADGSAELEIRGSGFFRAIWIDEIVINGIEIRPMAIDSIEFDEAGTAEIGFIAIKPGTYELRSQSSTLKVTIQ